MSSEGEGCVQEQAHDEARDRAPNVPDEREAQREDQPAVEARVRRRQLMLDG